MNCVGQDLQPLSCKVHDNNGEDDEDDDDDGHVIQNPSAHILPNLNSCFLLFMFVTPTYVCLF
jgi:hypothetical protein